MRTRAVEPGPVGTAAEVVPVVNIMLVYEDCDTGLRAKHSLDVLPDHFKLEPGIRTKLWRCDLLEAALLREQAAIEAAVSDVIIISLHGRELPMVVRQWLDRWVEHKEARPYALGVLLDPEVASQGPNNPVIAHARRVADAAGADLFYGFCETAPLQPSPPRTKAAKPPSHPPLLAPQLRPLTNGWRDWGLNE